MGLYKICTHKGRARDRCELRARASIRSPDSDVSRSTASRLAFLEELAGKAQRHVLPVGHADQCST